MSILKRILTVIVLLLGCTIVPLAEEYGYEEENPPSVTSDYIYLIDIDNGQVLWSMRGEDAMYPASLTKIMTAVLAMESLSDFEERILITEDMWAGLVEENASVAGFRPGDEPTVRDLLYGVLLPSGADAVNALALRISGSVSAFVDAMNRKAAELGMTSTHFTNPTGLHSDTHVSSPKDMAVLMEYALQSEQFREMIASRTYISSPIASAPEGLVLHSTSWPLINDGPDTFSIPGYLGGKTGFTNPAGRCLASHAEFGGMHLVLISGHSRDFGHIQDAATVYNWFNDNYARTTYLSEGTLLKTIAVIDSSRNAAFDLVVPDTRTMDLPKDAVIEVTVDVPDELIAPITEGDDIGSMQVTANGTRIYETRLQAPQSFRYSRLMHAYNAAAAFHASHRILFWILCILAAFVLFVLIARIRIHIRRARRRRRRKRRTSKR